MRYGIMIFMLFLAMHSITGVWDFDSNIVNFVHRRELYKAIVLLFVQHLELKIMQANFFAVHILCITILAVLERFK